MGITKLLAGLLCIKHLALYPSAYGLVLLLQNTLQMKWLTEETTKQGNSPLSQITRQLGVLECLQIQQYVPSFLT